MTEDQGTRTVADAAAFEQERAINAGEWEQPHRSDFQEYDIEDEDEDDCMCADPTCPCAGVKRGVP